MREDIDAKAAEAKFTDGVLALTLPRSVVASSRNVAIRQGTRPRFRGALSFRRFPQHAP